MQVQQAEAAAFTLYWYDKSSEIEPNSGTLRLGDLLGSSEVSMLAFDHFDPDASWSAKFEELIPAPMRALQTDHFVINAFGNCSAPETGSYEFRLLCDDGCRFLQDGLLVTDAIQFTVHGPMYSYFTLDLAADQRERWEIQYFEHTGDATLSFEVKLNGMWQFVNSSFCSPGEPPITVPFAGNTYRALGDVFHSDTMEGCQSTNNGYSAYLDDSFVIPVDSVDIQAMMTHYQFGTSCILVRSAQDKTSFVGLRTNPPTLQEADRYCDISGLSVTERVGAWSIENDHDCTSRLLLMREGIVGSKDHAYGAQSSYDVKSFYFEEAAFASIDGSYPTDPLGKGNCKPHRAYLMPPGWELAPDDDLTRTAMIGSAYIFGAHCLLLQGGSKISSITGDTCQESGSLDFTSFPGFYSVDSCTVGVLIKNSEALRRDSDFVWEEHWAITTPTEYRHVLQSGGKLYGSILGTSPRDASTKACQNRARRIPDGYTLVPPVDTGMATIAAYARFGSSCLLYADGTGIIPRTGELCKSELISKKLYGKTYYAVRECSSVVMMVGDAPPPGPNDKCGTCIAWGDPHYKTFDGHVYGFFGLGEYWISVATVDTHPTENDVDWNVRGLQERVTPVGSKFSTIVVEYHGDIILVDCVRTGQPNLPTLLINGIDSTMARDNEGTLASGAVIRRTGSVIIGSHADRAMYTVTLPNGVIVRVRAAFYLINFLDVEVVLPHRYGESALGLCGSCDGDVSNDLKKPNCGTEPLESTQAELFHSFGQTWKVENTNNEPESNCKPPVTQRATSSSENDIHVDPDPDLCVSVSRHVRKDAELACASFTGRLYKSCMTDVCATRDSSIAKETAMVQSKIVESVLGRGPQCSQAKIRDEHTSIHGITYALLDSTHPGEINSGCQKISFRVPPGWKLAPDTPLHRAALSCHPWGTDCILLASGKSYNPELDECRSGDLLREGQYADCYRPATCNSRILLVKKPESDAIVQNRKILVDPRDSSLAENWKPIVYRGTTYLRSTDSVYNRPGEGSIYTSSTDQTTSLGALFQSKGPAYFGIGFKIGAWAKGINVERGSTASVADFSLYLDIYFTDNTASLGVYYAPFEGTGDWEYKDINVRLDPEKTVRLINVYFLFRKHSGSAFFSNVEIDVLDDDAFNLLKQGDFDSGADRWVDLDSMEAVETEWRGSDGYAVVDRTKSVYEKGISGLQQTVVITTGDLKQAFPFENDWRMDSLFFSGNAKASSFIPSASQLARYFSIYLDLMYTDFTATYGVYEPFDTTQTTTQTANRVFRPSSTAVSLLSFNAFVKMLKGKVEYDDLFLTTTCHYGAKQSVEGGLTYGDPHIKTLDATSDKRGHFDIHAIGEFVLYHDKLVEVQTRHSENNKAAVNTAFHVHTPAVDFQVDCTKDNNDPKVRMDGKDILLMKGSTYSFNRRNGDVRSTTKILFHGSVGMTTNMRISIQVTTKSGSDTLIHKIQISVHLAEGGQQFMQALIHPPIQFVGQTSGLLGNFDGDPDNDMKGRYHSQPVGTEEEFAEAWRLSYTDSAFVYDEGIDGSIYTDLSFKPQTMDLFIDRDREWARGICKSVGVTLDMLDCCIFDVLVGGEANAVSGYAPIAAMQTAEDPLLVRVHTGVYATSQPVPASAARAQDLNRIFTLLMPLLCILPYL